MKLVTACQLNRNALAYTSMYNHHHVLPGYSCYAAKYLGSWHSSGGTSNVCHAIQDKQRPTSAVMAQITGGALYTKKYLSRREVAFCNFFYFFCISFGMFEKVACQFSSAKGKTTLIQLAGVWSSPGLAQCRDSPPPNSHPPPPHPITPPHGWLVKHRQ